MFTYEMIATADENGKTYESKYGIYSKEKGFRFYRSVISNQTDRGVENIINNLFHEDCWKLKVEKPAKKKMTKEEIEKALGYEIDIVGKDGRRKFDDIHEFFKYLLEED